MNNLPASRSIGIDAIFQFTGIGAQVFSGTVFYIIVVRLFNTSAVGAISVFVAIIGLFNIVFQFGLGTGAQHFISYHMGRNDLGAARRTLIKVVGYGFLFSLIGFAFLYMISPIISLTLLHSASYSYLVKLLGIVLLGNVLFGILNGALLGMQSFKLSGLLNMMIWIAYYFGAVLLALFVRDLLTIILGWIIGISVGVVMEAIIVLRLALRFQGNGQGVSNGFLFNYSIPILLSMTIAYGAVYADRFVVAGLMTLSQLGIYNFALLIATSLSFLASPFNNILLPKFSEWYSKGMFDPIRQNARVAVLLLSSIYIPAAVGIVTLSRFILMLLAGPVYMSAAFPLDIIMLISAVFIGQNVIVQSLAAIRRTKVFLVSSVASLSANVVVSFTLIPYLGIVGASLGFSSVFIVTFVILYYFANKYGIASTNLGGTAKIWFASALMFVCVHLVSVYTGENFVFLPLYIILGVLIYILVVRTIRVFSKNDIDLLLSFFPISGSIFQRILTFVLGGKSMVSD